MPDNKVLILVEAQAQLDALVSAREQISGLKAQLGEGSGAAKMLDQTMGSLDKVIKAGVGGSIPEAAHHLELFGLKGHEAHLALRLLGSTAEKAQKLIEVFTFMPHYSLV